MAGEVDFHDDFGWLDITHGLTYANAARWHADGRSDPDVLRLALWTRVPGPLDRPPRVAHRGRRGRRGRHRMPTISACAAPARRCSAGRCSTARSAFIVHAHAVKTTTAATAEAVRAGNDVPLQAAARFLDAPKLERFVAANVIRSIDFVSGRTVRDE